MICLYIVTEFSAVDCAHGISHTDLPTLSISILQMLNRYQRRITYAYRPSFLSLHSVSVGKYMFVSCTITCRAVNIHTVKPLYFEALMIPIAVYLEIICYL